MLLSKWTAIDYILHKLMANNFELVKHCQLKEINMIRATFNRDISTAVMSLMSL